MKRRGPAVFWEAAKHGSFVYAYLRQHDRTPYYIGIGSRYDRPFADHTCELPAHDGLIVLMRSGLSWEEACRWEKFYIDHYGRKDEGTGILWNRTDGGEGSLGWIQSEETRAKRSRSLTGRKQTAAERKAHSLAMKGKTLSEEHKRKVGLASRGRKHTAEARAKMSAKVRAHKRTEEHSRNQHMSRRINTANRYQIPVETWLSLDKEQTKKVTLRYWRGKRGVEELLAGIVAAAH